MNRINKYIDALYFFFFKHFFWVARRRLIRGLRAADFDIDVISYNFILLTKNDEFYIMSLSPKKWEAYIGFSLDTEAYGEPLFMEEIIELVEKNKLSVRARSVMDVGE